MVIPQLNHRQKQASEVGHDDVIKFELNIAMHSHTAKADLFVNNLLKNVFITRTPAVDMVLWQSVPRGSHLLGNTKYMEHSGN